MTELNNEEILCVDCNKLLPKNYFSGSNIFKKKNAGHCRVCDWIKRHKGIPHIEGFTDAQVKSALEFLLYHKSDYINDMAEEMNLSIESAIKLERAINIGNKVIRIRFICENCGKESEKFISAWKEKDHHYCSLDCYWEAKPQVVGSGKDNQFYNRIDCKCANCGKPLEVIPYNYKITNRNGDNHNFCNHQCYWEFRKKYYIGKNASRYGSTMSEENRQKQRKRLLISSRDSARLNSKIQLKINDLLTQNNIQYIREYIVEYYSLDNFLPEHNLIIEVMGDYWHSSPLRYNKEKYGLNEKQIDGVKRDKQKHTYILNHLGIEILYLWETDINNNIDVCKKLIIQYINNKGILDNYHSFNYHLTENNELSLNSNLIIPYQNLPREQYKKLLKKKVG